MYLDILEEHENMAKEIIEETINLVDGTFAEI